MPLWTSILQIMNIQKDTIGSSPFYSSISWDGTYTEHGQNEDSVGKD